MKIAQILSYLSFLRKWYSGFVIILSNIVPSLLVFELDGTPALCYAECMMVCWDGQLPHQLLRKCHFSLQRLWTKINQEQFQADVGLSGNLRYLKMILLKRSSDFGQDSWKSFFPKNMTLFIASYLNWRQIHNIFYVIDWNRGGGSIWWFSTDIEPIKNSIQNKIMNLTQPVV